MDKELKAIVRELPRQGFDWWITSKGHVAVYKDGKPVTTFAQRPTNFRSWRNAMAALKRAGFIWPPPR